MFQIKHIPVSEFGLILNKHMGIANDFTLGLTATTASPMAGYGRGHSIFLKMAMVAEF